MSTAKTAEAAKQTIVKAADGLGSVVEATVLYRLPNTTRACINCEFFDCGGSKIRQQIINNNIPQLGDCHHDGSPMFTPRSNSFCHLFCKST